MQAGFASVALFQPPIATKGPCGRAYPTGEQLKAQRGETTCLSHHTLTSIACYWVFVWVLLIGLAREEARGGRGQPPCRKEELVPFHLLCAVVCPFSFSGSPVTRLLEQLPIRSPSLQPIQGPAQGPTRCRCAANIC